MLTWIPDVGVLARIQLLRVISCWYLSCGDQQRALRNFEATTFVFRNQLLIYQPVGWKPAGNGAKLEPQSSSKSRKEQHKLSCRQNVRPRAEVAPESQLKNENKEAGEEKERALQELTKQPA
ncbi:hypothetical protein F511_31596 [Dorcoceras hygrometricum]|uniref:Uncharacterized protein n=1 Tax=Dorcoceras hygrometricum TaxID=472368 RepID=A0A2Z7D0E1_9LAMI|nr:hypothetical protein F511_31596 [Dorcoceras hygrometricum]